MIIYWPWLFKYYPHFDAICFLFFIFIKSNNPPIHLIKHERQHIKQQIKYVFVLYAILYFCFSKWKYKFELEAYAVSIIYGMSIYAASKHLSGPGYGNLVTQERAYIDLFTELDKRKNGHG